MIDPYDFTLRAREPLLVVISGPSGAGKDSVLAKLKEQKLPFKFVITATTRSPRPNEQHGIDYFFISKEQFKQMIANDELIEYAIVYEDYKGVPKEQVRIAFQSGMDVIMRVDVQGAARIRQLAPEAVLIFLTTGSEEEMIKRLELRQTENDERMQLRIATARKELERINEFDYVVVNSDDHLDEAVQSILAIISTEHHRVIPRKVTL